MLQVVKKSNGKVVEFVNGVFLFPKMVEGKLVVGGSDNYGMVYYEWFGDYEVSVKH